LYRVKAVRDGVDIIQPGDAMNQKIGTPRATGLHRWARFVARVVALVYLGMVLTLFLLQNYLIYPGASSQGHRDAVVPPDKNYELLDLRAADGTKIAAVFGKAMDQSYHDRSDYADRPTILFFYGNGQCLANSMDLFWNLRVHGFNVIVSEYEGYGMSGGKPSERGCYAAADAAYDYVLSRGDVNKEKIVVFGWSLGAAVAIDLADRRPVQGLITFSAFTTMKAMAHKAFPWLPTSLLLRSHFDNLKKIQGIDCPIFMVHGAEDDLVPPKMCGQLAAAAGKSGKVTTLEVPGAGHNDLIDVGGEDLMRKFAGFVEGLP
jgi:uncharacterized protein